MKILANLEKMRMWSLLLTVLGVTMVSCSDILEEEVVDCSVEYRVKFKYDHNMKFANAFANEVRSVTLYAFDQDGKFVYQRTEQGDILGEDDYTMPVEVEAGDYRFITWAGLEGEESFSVPVLLSTFASTTSGITSPAFLIETISPIFKPFSITKSSL